jgi:hypothetical protein
MKLNGFFISMATMAMLVIAIISCSSDEENVSTLAWSRFSGCKQEPLENRVQGKSTLPLYLECIEYEGRKSGQLYLKHVNAKLNCETERVDISTSIVDKHIKIVENPIGNAANCVCRMDIEYLLNGLSNGKYVVSIYQHSEANLQFEFTIDYSDTLKGTFEK